MFMFFVRALRPTAAVLALLAAIGTASAQEATIRKALTERLPNLPPIEEISKSCQDKNACGGHENAFIDIAQRLSRTPEQVFERAHELGLTLQRAKSD